MAIRVNSLLGFNYNWDLDCNNKHVCPLNRATEPENHVNY
ncbi:hypothetical protein FLA_5132 [Filimonas lacunae]|nr:hypothetical protein FLA_5132 [Filimonas lacunae]